MDSAQPLADRLRPADPLLFVGQAQIRQRVQTLLSAPHLPSLLLFGPPGCGKSTLALLLAHARSDRVLRLSAPESGLPNLRRQIQGAEILILDELHRYSKAQQDFFLPVLESGEVTLIATTTENPSFCVTRQLLSRLLVLRLQPLGRDDLMTLARRGAEELKSKFDDAVLDILCSASRGDARTLLNLLEYAAALPEEERTPAGIGAALPEILHRGDRNGDNHYEYISALIKSIRGSDPDAALYYLACLIESGEDPRFICRRLIIASAEDIGLADPQALPLAVACHQAVEQVGMPEGRIPMAETVTYLALARKSNTAYAGLNAALQEVRTNGPEPVPLHLRNASTALQKQWGYGKEYLYPHRFPGAWVKQTYLPERLNDRIFYTAKDNGEEPRINAWLKAKKRSQ
ncbi:MAG: replication-associated recombination protein A [Desulfovibrionaceae bacterium]|nr:replication-associated recombination protein A [Desulfovibrionaceae bacterium]